MFDLSINRHREVVHDSVAHDPSHVILARLAGLERTIQKGMADKLFEMKRLSSCIAACLIGVDHLTFLAQLQRFGVPVFDLADDELTQDVGNA